MSDDQRQPLTEDRSADYQVALDRAGTRTPSHPTREEIRLLSPDFYADFDDLTAWMRDSAPLYWDDATGIWGAASHSLVTRISRDHHTFCSGQGSRPTSSVPSMINTDPPDHTRRRRLIGAGFTPRRVAAHEDFLRRKATAMIDAVIERGECDVVRDLATPLPMYMIGELMGLPEDDHEQLLHWSDLFATGGDEIHDEVVMAVREFNDYLMEVIAERRSRSAQNGAAEDLMSLIVNADFEEPLSDLEIMFESMLVLVGGDETTRHVISGGLEQLIRHPDQLAALRADRELLPGAVEEMLRWATPVRNMNRTATADVEIDGQRIDEGDRILLLYPSANRDDEVFDDPFRFDIRRTPNNHVAFGAFGRHHCLGAPLARLEIRVLLEEVLDRMHDLELIPEDPGVQRRGNFVLGLESLPMRFRPAAVS